MELMMICWKICLETLETWVLLCFEDLFSMRGGAFSGYRPYAAEASKSVSSVWRKDGKIIQDSWL